MMERGEKLIGSVLITIEEIQMINGGDYEQAQSEHRNVINAIGSKSNQLMVTQYCEYYDLDQDEIFDFLNGHRYEPNYKIFVENGLYSYLHEPTLDYEDEDLFEFVPEETYEEYQIKLIEKGGINGCSTNNQ